MEENIVVKKNFVRRTYDWVLSWEKSPYGLLALFILAFIESSVFPIPPDILLIALCLANQKKSFKFALICSIGSVLGGMFGYFIGYSLFEVIGKPIIGMYHYEKQFANLCMAFNDYAFISVLIAAITPIPYKVFTIASGVAKADFSTFVLASVIGRSFRFFLVSGLIYKYGQPVKNFIDKYFDFLTIVFMLLLAGGFLLIKYAL